MVQEWKEREREKREKKIPFFSFQWIKQALKPVLSHSRKVKLPSVFLILAHNAHIYKTETRNVFMRMKNIFAAHATIFYRNFLAELRENFFIHEIILYTNYIIRNSRDVCLFAFLSWNCDTIFGFIFFFFEKKKKRWGFIVSSWLGKTCKKFSLFRIFYFQISSQDSFNDTIQHQNCFQLCTYMNAKRGKKEKFFSLLSHFLTQYFLKWI